MPSNQGTAEVQEVTAQELRQMLESPEPPYVLDVREPFELAQGVVPGSTNIPMNAVPERLQDLPRDRTIVAYCHIGERSYRVAHCLLRQGFDAKSLQGGIVAWENSSRPLK